MSNESYTDIITGSPVVPVVNGILNTTSATTILLDLPVARIQRTTMTASGQQLRLPNATLLSDGTDFVVVNAGANAFAVANSSGGVIQSIGAGDVYYVYLLSGATGAGTWEAKAVPGAGGVGTVSSVGLSLPSAFTVSGSPVTGSGTLAGAFASSAAAMFLATPAATVGQISLRTLDPVDYPTMVGDSGAGGTKGAVPAPAAGDAAALKYLRADGTWAVTTPTAGAPTTEAFLVLATSGSLSAERLVTAGSGISLADAGAGSTLTISMSNPLPVPSGNANMIPRVNSSATAYEAVQVPDWMNFMTHV